MSRHVAFLRAVNTTGRRVKNARLAGIIKDLGATYAQGFIASGNIVFDTDLAVDTSFIVSVESAFFEAYSFEIPTAVRSSEEVVAVASHRPFSADEIAASEGRIYVGFMRTEPSHDVVEEVEAMATATDPLRVVGRELFWMPRSGEFQSDISIPAIERLTGTMTVRVMTTVDRIVEKFLT